MTKSIDLSKYLIPTSATLKRYGIGPLDWAIMYEEQGRVCAICKKLPKSGRLHIDHEHVKDWKKLPPEKRKATVRGLICFQCNRFVVGRWGTLEKLRNAVIYLDAYEKRKSTSR